MDRSSINAATKTDVSNYDTLITCIQSLYDDSTMQYHELYKFINDSAQRLYKKSSNQLETKLSEPNKLQLPQHTLAYTILLSSRKCSDINTNYQQYHALSNQLFNTADINQLSICLSELITIVCNYGLLMQQHDAYQQSLQSLFNAIQLINKLQANTLTSAHRYTLIAIQKLNLYNNPSIIELLDYPYYCVIPTTTAVTDIQHILLYYYYAGNINAAMKRYSHAIQCYVTVLSIPSFGVVSAIQIAAYKRYIVVSLLHHNTVDILNSRTVSTIVARNIESLDNMEIYQNIKNAYMHGTQAELNVAIESKSTELQSDNMSGLCNRLPPAQIVCAITKQTHIYKTLTFQQLKNIIKYAQSIENFEQLLLSLIEQDLIHAALDCGLQHINFIDHHDHTYDNVADVQLISNQLQLIKQLNMKLQQVDLEYSINSIYLNQTNPLLSDNTNTNKRGHNNINSNANDRQMQHILEISKQAK